MSEPPLGQPCDLALQHLPGRVSDRLTGFEDWLPTLLDVADGGASVGGGGRGAASGPDDGSGGAPSASAGRVEDSAGGASEDRPATDGISLVPLLRGEDRDERPFLYREFAGYGGQQAVWRGRWKAVRRGLRELEAGDTPVTELYDLQADPSESTDLAAQHPDVVAELEALLTREHVPEPDFPLPVLDG